MLVNSFDTFDITKLPHSPLEVRQSAPSGWSPLIEQTLMRSMSFTEYEMNSHPLVFLTVISTEDVDPIACMQELTSHQHIPACYSTGQYDPNIHRVYLLLHDNSNPATASIDKDMILRQLKSKFSPTHTKMLCVNSLPEDSPNLQHPDIWEAWRIPMFFPQHAPSAVHPESDSHPPVVGSRLSMEDFMELRNFCVELFQQEVLPAYERRVSVLSRIVTETKKGMRNVIKNFWRKPQAQESKKGSSRYRYDKIEAQILLLADTAFNMRDYEAAMSMYKLVKDDFKADKSVLHIAHVTLMTAACHFMLEPNSRLRDIGYYTETLNHIHAASKTEVFPVQTYAYYALIMSEILTMNVHSQAPLEAAHILLQASSYTAKSMPLLSALLTEKASYCYLQAGQERKFSLQVVLTGQRFQSLGSATGTVGTGIGQACTKHACVCFAVAMIFHDQGKWGTVKSRLWRSLADKLRERATLTEIGEGKENDKEGEERAEGGVDAHAKQALLFLLHILRAVSPTDDTYSGTVALLDAVNAYHELIHEEMWSGVNVTQGWEQTTTREILLNETSHAFQQVTRTDLQIIPGQLTVIEDLRIPEIITSSVMIMTPLNGSSTLVPHGSTGGKNRLVNFLTSQLLVEIDLEKEQHLLNLNRSLNQRSVLSGSGKEEEEDEEDVITTTASSHLETNPLLLESWADKYLEAKFNSLSKQPGGRASLQMFMNNIFTAPIGETVIVAMTISNTLPVELTLKDFKIILQEAQSTAPSSGEEIATTLSTDAFDMFGIDIVLPSGAMQDLTLQMKPKQRGTFSIIGASYILGDKIQVIQHIDKPGPLLLRTQKQRTEKQRGRDETLIMKVVDPSPCVRVIVNQGNPIENILCGEIFQTDIEFHNEGNAPASDLSFIFDHPIGVVKYQDEESFLPFFGQSCTAMRLPPRAVILPGESVHLKAWFRLCDAGRREVSLLASYHQQDDSKATRSCFTNFEVTVSPSLSTAMSIVGSKTESLSKTIVIDILNSVNNTFSSLDEDDISVAAGGKETIPEFMTREGESCATMDAVLVVGDINTPGTVLGTRSANGDVCLVNADERMNIFVPIMLHPPVVDVPIPVPVDVTDKGSSAITTGQTEESIEVVVEHIPPHHYNSKWISTAAKDTDSTTSLEMNTPTFDMFSYLSFCKHALQSEMGRAGERRQKAELSGEEFTPRTISQVRRARSSELQNTSTSSGSSSSSSSSSPRGRKRGRNHHLLDVIAAAEVEHNEATVVIAWSCFWRGKLHRGLNVLHHQKLFKSEFMKQNVRDLQASTSVPTILRGYCDIMQSYSDSRRPPFSLESQLAADRLTVTLVAPQALSWDFSSHGRCPLTVSLDIYSNHPEANIVISVEALEWLDLNVPGADPNASFSSPNKSNTTGGRGRKRPPVKGLRWEGKSRFVDIVIPPLSSVSLPFLALIARKGVFDIKRCVLYSFYLCDAV